MPRKFQKKPDEGRMKGLAFALDPDGYWVEIVPRTNDLARVHATLQHTEDAPDAPLPGST